MNRNEIDKMIRNVYGFDRAQCKTELTRIVRPKLDLTEEYLEAMSVERLRHILVAAYLQANKPKLKTG